MLKWFIGSRIKKAIQNKDLDFLRAWLIVANQGDEKGFQEEQKEEIPHFCS